MKTYLLFVISILFSVAVSAQVKTTGPIMKFDKTNHDYGDVTEGNKVLHTFTYTNTGTDTLKIDQIASSCGCTVANEYERVVAPGHSSKITVEFNSANKSGVTNKTLTILSNAVTEQPAVMLSIRANVIPKN